MVQASQPDTDSSTGTMILGVQCACRVIQWKDGDHSIEPCQLHAVADDLLKALEVVRLGFKYIMEGQVLDAVYLLRDSPQAKALDYTDLLWAMWHQQSATSQEVADILEAIARAAIKEAKS